MIISSLAPSRILVTLLISLLVGVSFISGVYLTKFNNTVPAINLSNSRSIQSCLQDTNKLINPSPLTPEFISKIIEVCYDEINRQYKLNDFELRRLAFVSRYYADRITLWMVVVITVSGVALAGLQLAASYQLAQLQGKELGTDNELTIEQGKMIFRSSITGLFVLIISFAFFLIYVRYIYVMPEVNVDAASRQNTDTVVPTLSPGGLGVAPPVDSPPDPTPRGQSSPQLNQSSATSAKSRPTLPNVKQIPSGKYAPVNK